MRFFYSKINKFCFATIDKKLKHNSTTAANCTTDNFLAFTKEPNKPARQSNNSRNSYSNNHIGQERETQQQKSNSYTTLLSQEHCFYCDKAGHGRKDEKKTKWISPDKLSGKPHCDK